MKEHVSFDSFLVPQALEESARAVGDGLLFEKAERERERREGEQRQWELQQQALQEHQALRQQAFVMHNQNLALSVSTQQALDGAVSDVLAFGDERGREGGQGGGNVVGGVSSVLNLGNGHFHGDGRGQRHWDLVNTSLHADGEGSYSSRRLNVRDSGGGGGRSSDGSYSVGVGKTEKGGAKLDNLMHSVSRSLGTHMHASKRGLAFAAGGSVAGEGGRGPRGGGMRAGGDAWESDSELSAFASNASSRWSSPLVIKPASCLSCCAFFQAKSTALR